MQVLA